METNMSKTSKIAILSLLMGVAPMALLAQSGSGTHGTLAAYSRTAAAMPAEESGNSVLLVTADLDCTLTVDGVGKGHLKAGEVRTVPIMEGNHLVKADGDKSGHWESAATTEAGKQKFLPIVLDDSLPTWTDPATGLMWTKEDNGKSVTWMQASIYCHDLRLGGHADWRMPDIGELGALYIQVKWSNKNDETLHIKGNLHASAWEWSYTAQIPEGAWAFSFRRIEHGSVLLDNFYSYDRVLCVRSAGK